MKLSLWLGNEFNRTIKSSRLVQTIFHLCVKVNETMRALIHKVYENNLSFSQQRHDCVKKSLDWCRRQR